MAGNYDQIITRQDADVLIPEEAATEVLEAATSESVALELCQTAPMSSKVRVMPVLAALPVAYWVSGDTGLKQTTEAAWEGAELVAEELATIVPIPEAVLDDADIDIWAALRPVLGEAVALKLDQAVFAGVDKPASWPEAIIPAAQAAGNVVTAAATAEQGGVYGDLEALMGEVEDDGFEVTGFAAAASLKRKMRQARSTTGEALGDSGASFNTGGAWGVRIGYAMPGVFPAGVHAVGGDYRLACVGVRKDLTYKVLDQAVISDEDGKVVYNLPQQDMIALRVTARFGFAVGVPATRAEVADAFPFATLQDAAVGGAAARTSKAA